MTWIALAAVLLSAEPDAKQLELLKVFRSEFVEITPGKAGFPADFLMGSTSDGEAELPPHRVTMTRPFLMARYEVPQNLWQAVMGGNPSRWKGPRNSVEMLSFDAAEQFCRQATQLMRAARLIEAGQVVRLPSEAEWEYAARAGTATKYSFGDDPADLGDYAWFHGNAAGNDPPVGAKRPSGWKLYDMHGYLWEWCSDVWHDNYEDAPTDGSAWTKGGDPNRRVLRSGSWKDPAERLTSSFRQPGTTKLRDDSVGLRCVLASKEE